jgi:hypothetical protein
MYCGHSSSLVAIHTRKLQQAFIELFNSADLRKKMGENGKRRATMNYDWSVIIPKYEELWAEQSRRRVASKSAYEESDQSQSDSQPQAIWPARLDPTIGFAHYPTQHLGLLTRLRLTEPTAAAARAQLDQLKGLDMVSYASAIIPLDGEIEAVFSVAETYLPNGCSAEDLLGDIDPTRKPYVLRGLVWLCKLGLFEFS